MRARTLKILVPTAALTVAGAVGLWTAASAPAAEVTPGGPQPSVSVPSSVPPPAAPSKVPAAAPTATATETKPPTGVPRPDKSWQCTTCGWDYKTPQPPAKPA